MRKVLISLIMLASSALAQVAVTGTVKKPDPSISLDDVKVRFTLRNCDPYSPRVAGSVFIVASPVEFTPNASTGAITGQIYGNHEVTCDVIGNTYWTVAIVVKGQVLPGAQNYCITGAFDLDAAIPCNVTTLPTPTLQQNVILNPLATQTINTFALIVPGGVTANLTGNVTGTASTATALSANGANCTAGNSPLGVDALGAVEGCYDVATQVELDTHSGLTTAHGSTSVNTASTIVQRDASGNFTAGTVTAAISGNVTGNVTGNVVGNLTGAVTGNASTATTAGALTANGSNCPAGSVAAGVDAAGASEGCIAADSANTASAIVQRDASGNFSAGVVSAATVAVAGTTLSGSASTPTFASIAGTWNTSGTPTALKVAVIDTASGTAYLAEFCGGAAGTTCYYRFRDDGLFSGSVAVTASSYLMAPQFRTSNSASFTTMNLVAGDNSGNWAPTSGTTSGFSFSQNLVPTSGTGVLRAISNALTVNQTGGANGAYSLFYGNVTETAVGASTSANKLLDLNVGAARKFDVDSTGAVTAKTRSVSGGVSVVFSATPTFDSAMGNTFEITLTGNVSSSTLSNLVAFQNYDFIICQDATGSRTFVWPTNVSGGMTIGATASRCSAQSFRVNAAGNKAYATSSGVINML